MSNSATAGVIAGLAVGIVLIMTVSVLSGSLQGKRSALFTENNSSSITEPTVTKEQAKQIVRDYVSTRYPNMTGFGFYPVYYGIPMPLFYYYQNGTRAEVSFVKDGGNDERHENSKEYGRAIIRNPCNPPDRLCYPDFDVIDSSNKGKDRLVYAVQAIWNSTSADNAVARNQQGYFLISAQTGRIVFSAPDLEERMVSLAGKENMVCTSRPDFFSVTKTRQHQEEFVREPSILPKGYLCIFGAADEYGATMIYAQGQISEKARYSIYKCQSTDCSQIRIQITNMTHILTSGSVTPPVRYTEEGTLIMPDWNITQRNLHNKALKEEFAIARLADPSIIGINAKGASLVLLKERCDFCHGNRIAEISYYIDGYLYEIDSADLPIVEILPVVRSMH